MLHLSKLAVGVRDVAHLREIHAQRRTSDPVLRHRTRNQPRRRDEVLDGGSIYWVISGAMVVRQRILDIRADQWEDGSACAALILDPDLVTVAGRTMRPFQGWRYLQQADAPPDWGGGAEWETDLPLALRQELRNLCLI